MSQLPLFAQSSETVLVDDARGRIVYTPDFVPADVAAAWFDEVRGVVAWETQRRRMYDREVDVPRLVGHFALVPPSAHVPEAIRAAARPSRGSGRGEPAPDELRHAAPLHARRPEDA